MNNEEKILQLLEAQQKEFGKINDRLDKVDSRLDKVDSRLDKMESRLDRLEADVAELKESAEITRDGVNALIEWAEDCGNVIKFPLPKIAK